jgi:hypothetical protein
MARPVAPDLDLPVLPEPAPFYVDPSLDLSLPFWVSTDLAIAGTFDNPEDAVGLADRVAMVEPKGARVMVTYHGIGFYSTTGHGPHASRPPYGKGF